jgi:hypothetical protein
MKIQLEQAKQLQEQHQPLPDELKAVVEIHEKQKQSDAASK